jgi:hypothetical protein
MLGMKKVLFWYGESKCLTLISAIQMKDCIKKYHIRNVSRIKFRKLNLGYLARQLSTVYSFHKEKVGIRYTSAISLKTFVHKIWGKKNRARIKRIRVQKTR